MNYFDPVKDKEVFYCCMPSNQVQYEKALIKLVDMLNIYEAEIRETYPDFEIENAIKFSCDQLKLKYLIQTKYLNLFPGFDQLEFKKRIQQIFYFVFDENRMNFL